MKTNSLAVLRHFKGVMHNFVPLQRELLNTASNQLYASFDSSSCHLMLILDICEPCLGSCSHGEGFMCTTHARARTHHWSVFVNRE